MRALALAIALALGRLASADPITGIGPEAAWVAPSKAMELDLTGGSSRAVSGDGKRRLPHGGFLLAQVGPGRTIWVRFDRDDAASSVRFVWLSGDLRSVATVDVEPVRIDARNVTITAPAGPPRWIGLGAPGVRTAPTVEMFVAATQSPGFRWELWEEEAQKWAARPTAAPPAPPTDGGDALEETLAILGDLVALARSEGGSAPTEPLLRAEALLGDLPLREPSFPYFRRIELTGAVAGGRPKRIVGGRAAFDVAPGSLQFTVDGPGVLRIDAQRVFPGEPSHHPDRLELALFAGRRLLANSVDEVTPLRRGTKETLSSVRRLVFAAPPGRHTYELRVVGGPTRLAFYLHRRSMHAEDLITGSEDLAGMLARCRTPGSAGVLGDLVAAEAAWLAIDDEAARPHFEALATGARAPRLRAFALGRLASIEGNDASGGRTAAAVAQLTAGAVADVRLRRRLIADEIVRGLSGGDPHAATELARTSPEAVAQHAALIGPTLREIGGARSRSLPPLEAAALAHPLDAGLRRRLAREWWTGSQWSALPPTEHDGAQRVNVIMPADHIATCAEAAEQHAHAYLPIASGRSLALSVGGAPDAFLHRFHLLVLRAGGARLGWMALRLDDETTRLPLVLPVERVPLAAAVGAHALLVQLTGGVVLAPCALAGEGTGLLVERRYSQLPVRGSRARVTLFEPGVRAYVGIELRIPPELKLGRVRVRTDQGVLGTIELHGSRLDEKLVAGERAGPPVTVVMAVPPTARELEIVREDEGAPILVRALLRRGIGTVPAPSPRPPVVEPDPAGVEKLRSLSRAVLAASAPGARAEARVKRAEWLIDLDALTAARNDLELAIPHLEDAAAERARALLRSLADAPLIAANGVRAKVLAAGAGIPASADSACVDLALDGFKKDPASARAQVATCPGALAAYVAAQLEEADGAAGRAAALLGRAYAEVGAPGLARDAAMRFSEQGSGRGAAAAYAWAAAAARDGDVEAGRAMRRLSSGSRWHSIAAVDVGTTLRLDESSTAAPPLRAALADVPWPPGSYNELRANRANELVFTLEQPIAIELRAACEVGGRLDDEQAACRFRLEIDGAKLSASSVQGGELGRIARVSLRSGEHRVSITLEPSALDPVAFVQVATDRRVGQGAAAKNDQGLYVMSARRGAGHRFVVGPNEPVRLRVQGPTALRIDALCRAQESPAIEISDTSPERSDRRTYPLCDAAREHLPTPLGGYDRRSQLVVPLLGAGTHELVIAARTSSHVAISLAFREEEPNTSTGEPPPVVPALPDLRLVSTSVETQRTRFPPPRTRFELDTGALQIQQLGVIGGPGAVDPRVGDRFSETAILYRRRVERIPLWILAGAFLRLRPAVESAWGPPSFGGQFLWFTRIPPIKLRWLGDVRVFTQQVAGHQEVSVALETYLERSFEVAPRFYLLPRVAFAGKYQSLKSPPLAPPNDPLGAVPIDPQVWNNFSARHDAGMYGQLLIWWVPFINMIVYAEGRVASLRMSAVDRASGRAGFDVAFHGTEIIGYYDATEFFADPVRRSNLLQHRLAGEIDQNFWAHRNHRVVLRLGGALDPVSLSSTVFFGAFWEMSFGRGLDDYSTPQINLPQQLGRGRGVVGPEHRL